MVQTSKMELGGQSGVQVQTQSYITENLSQLNFIRLKDIISHFIKTAILSVSTNQNLMVLMSPHNYEIFLLLQKSQWQKSSSYSLLAKGNLVSLDRSVFINKIALNYILAKIKTLQNLFSQLPYKTGGLFFRNTTRVHFSHYP